nr:hypothetical protein [Tanacetum cinerariifolium]
DGASGLTVVEEGEPVDAAGSRATTSAIGAITSGAGRSTLGGGLTTAFAHKNNEAFAKINIVRAASINVRLRLSTTPFCCGEQERMFMRDANLLIIFTQSLINKFNSIICSNSPDRCLKP